MTVFTTFAILYFLLSGINSVGLAYMGYLPKSKEDYVPIPKRYYYMIGTLNIGIALWGAVVLV